MKWNLAFWLVLVFSISAVLFIIPYTKAGDPPFLFEDNCQSYVINEATGPGTLNGCPLNEIGILEVVAEPFVLNGVVVERDCNPHLETGFCRIETPCLDIPISGTNNCVWGGIVNPTDCSSSTQCVATPNGCGCGIPVPPSGVNDPEVAIPQLSIEDGDTFEVEDIFTLEVLNTNLEVPIQQYDFTITDLSGTSYPLGDYILHEPHLESFNSGIDGAFIIDLRLRDLFYDYSLQNGEYTIEVSFWNDFGPQTLPYGQSSGPTGDYSENKDGALVGISLSLASGATCGCKNIKIATTNTQHNPGQPLPTPTISALTNLGVPKAFLLKHLSGESDRRGLGMRYGVLERVADDFSIPYQPNKIINTALRAQAFSATVEFVEGSDPNGCLNGQIAKKQSVNQYDMDGNGETETEVNRISIPLSRAGQPILEPVENPDASNPAQVPHRRPIVPPQNGIDSPRWIHDGYNLPQIPGDNNNFFLETRPIDNEPIRHYIDSPGAMFDPTKLGSSFFAADFIFRVVPDGPFLDPPKPSRKTAVKVDSRNLFERPYPKIGHKVDSVNYLRENSCECVFKIDHQYSMGELPGAVATLDVPLITEILTNAQFASKFTLDEDKSVNCDMA